MGTLPVAEPAADQGRPQGGQQDLQCSCARHKALKEEQMGCPDKDREQEQQGQPEGGQLPVAKVVSFVEPARARTQDKQGGQLVQACHGAQYDHQPQPGLVHEQADLQDPAAGYKPFGRQPQQHKDGHRLHPCGPGQDGTAPEEGCGRKARVPGPVAVGGKEHKAQVQQDGNSTGRTPGLRSGGCLAIGGILGTVPCAWHRGQGIGGIELGRLRRLGYGHGSLFFKNVA